MDKQSKLHDKCKQVVLFHNHLVKFFKALTETCPEFKRDIAKCIKYYQQTERSVYINKTHQLMEPHIQKISEYDEGIFSNDYQSGSLKLIPGLDFKKIFAAINDDDDENFTEDDRNQTKKSIFNHLQSIYISTELSLAQIQKFDKAMGQQKEMLLSMLKNLHLDENLKEKIEKITEEENAQAAAGGGFDLSQLDKLGELLGEDNFIVQLAKDVANEINLGTEGEEGNAPVDAISRLFANNGQKLQELLVSVGDKIEQRIKNGDITQEQLLGQAQEMKDRVGSFMGKIPGLDGIMKNLPTMNGSQMLGSLPELLAKNPETWTDEERQTVEKFVKESEKSADN